MEDTKDKKRSDLILQLGALENQMMQSIADSGNTKLMDMFLDWQKIRDTLNADMFSRWEEIYTMYVDSKENKVVDRCNKCGAPLHFAMGSLFCPNQKC